MSIDKKNVIWNMIGATVSAFNSLFFAIIVTRINGIDDAGIFAYCFSMGGILYCIANYCGRTFQVTDISKKNSDTDYIYNRVITCIIMIVIAILFVLIKGYDIYKCMIFVILALFKGAEAFADVLYGIIQKNEQLYKAGKSMFIKAIVSLASLLIIDIITKDLILSCLSLLIVHIVFIIIYDFKNIRKVKLTKTKFSNKANKNLLKAGFFTFTLSFLSLYLTNIQRYAIDDLLENSFQTIFGIIIMPAAVMSLLAIYIIQPLLTRITGCIENKKYEEFKSIIKKIVFLILILGVVVTLVACILELPVLEFIYGIELDEYYASMMIIVVGSIFYSLLTILSAILIAMRKTFSQSIIYGLVSIVSTILSYLLISNMEIYGASIAYSITMFIIALIFLIYTLINMKKYKKDWKEG